MVLFDFLIFFCALVSNDSRHILIVFCMGSIVRDFLFGKGTNFVLFCILGIFIVIFCQQNSSVP